jgi:hypothetical protein
MSEWVAIAAVLLGYTTGFLMRGLWCDRRRDRQGRIDTAEAEALWAEGEEMRRFLRSESLRLNDGQADG